MADQDSSLVDWSDSFYMHVQKRITALNPNRAFGGIVEARDWPLKSPTLEAFYLLTTTLNPGPGNTPGSNSWSAPLYGERAQWAWQIQGDNLVTGVLASNRGDRYRKHFSLIQELLNGMYPGFCEKLHFTVDTVDGQHTLVSTPYMPSENIWWGKPSFSDRIDTNTGIMFGTAAFEVSAFAPAVIS